MADLPQAGLVAAVLIILGLAPLAIWLVQLVWKARLLRCPETGGVALVDVASPLSRESRYPQVRHCELWPGQRQCAQGCLERYAETPAAQAVSLAALRRFHRQ